MKKMVRRKVFFLPMRSPMRPKNKPPKGLKKNPNMKIEMTLNKLIVGELCLKKRDEIVGAQ
jgi:hypothetical protein